MFVCIVRQLIEEARRVAQERDRSRTVVFVAEQYGNWKRNASRPRRPLDSVVSCDFHCMRVVLVCACMHEYAVRLHDQVSCFAWTLETK